MPELLDYLAHVTYLVTGTLVDVVYKIKQASRSWINEINGRAGVIFQDHLSRPLFNISGQSVSQPGPQYPCGRELSRQKSTYPGYPGIPIYYRAEWEVPFKPKF
jgi:hypothetical protein